MTCDLLFSRLNGVTLRNTIVYISIKPPASNLLQSVHDAAPISTDRRNLYCAENADPKARPRLEWFYMVEDLFRNDIYIYFFQRYNFLLIIVNEYILLLHI